MGITVTVEADDPDELPHITIGSSPSAAVRVEETTAPSLCRSFVALSRQIDDLLGRGHDVNILPLETGLTDSLLIELASRHPGHVVVKRTTGYVESLEGMDFEMRITDFDFALNLRVQAKKMDPRDGIYPELQKKRTKAKDQCDNLITHARKTGAYPLYLFYNALDASPMRRDPGSDWQYGCAIASPQSVKRVLQGAAPVTFDAFYQAPWHYLVCPDEAVSVLSIASRLDTLFMSQGDEELRNDAPTGRVGRTNADDDIGWINAPFPEDLKYRVLLNLNYQ